MDRRPTLETRPPVLIDAVVRALIPPACREHVVGDLWERYRSPIVASPRDDCADGWNGHRHSQEQPGLGTQNSTAD